MPRPDVPGMPITNYEEVWRELAPFPDDDDDKPNTDQAKGISYILDSEKIVDVAQEPAAQSGVQIIVATRTFIARSHGLYVALRQRQTYKRHWDTVSNSWVVTDRSGQGEVSARREEWGPSGWSDKYVLGNGSSLPSMKDGLDGEGKGAWQVEGQTVVVGGEPYIVRAFEPRS